MMPTGSITHVVLIHNEDAGDTEHGRASLLHLVRQQGYDVESFDPAEIWQSLTGGVADFVIAAGGDGTVANVARRMAGSNVPLAVLPLGTANNIATVLGLAKRPISDLIAGWSKARRQVCDLGRLTQSRDSIRFVESVGIGLLAESISKITHGDAGYVDELDGAEERLAAAVGVLRTQLSELQPTPLELVLDGERFSSEYLLMEVMNLGCAGPRLWLAPDADHTDGCFDVVMAEAHDRGKLMTFLEALAGGKHSRLELPVRRARDVVIQAAGVTGHSDDRVHTFDGRSELSVVQHALTFLV